MFEEKLKGRTIALIGGAGFIGHNLALALKQHGADPHVIDGFQVNNLGALHELGRGSQQEPLCEFHLRAPAAAARGRHSASRA